MYISSEARRLNFSWNFNLHPCFVYANNKGAGDSVNFGRLTFIYMYVVSTKIEYIQAHMLILTLNLVIFHEFQN